jgi:hypothetical protein
MLLMAPEVVKTSQFESQYRIGFPKILLGAR